jgi:eukaryotic-like serine/threonine-protein kinase
MTDAPEALQAAVRAWDRYQVKELVGSGGGGFVWRAHDPRVGRDVALKFLRVEDARLAARLLREAQAQARIDHPNVCKVYDVGSLDGRPYIVMQFCDGKTLDDAAPAMTLEARAAVMRDVADAIHAAHRLGLVHRDLKPGNVLVEETDGAFRPYVVDFGLARELEAPGITTTGMVVGTPAYMAPEQARGDAAVDRRTDVYGLGATLYHLLTGRAPFGGDSAVGVMLQVLHDEPAPPRKLAPSLPLDLETIALTCLEKEPGRRYPSARAVADDLGRFLDGEPIEARRRGPLGRAWRWARKRRALVALVSLAVAALGAGGGYGLWAQRASLRRARAAAEFGRSSEQMQSLMERAHLLPLHDLRPDARAVRQRLSDIEARIGELGSFAEGPGRYARGRGFLALYEYEPARAELERAWRAGERTPDVALALGQALGEIYQVRRKEALRLDEPLRSTRLAEARRELRDPALERLRSAGGAPYVEGLIALDEERWDDALARGRAASDASPWFYPAARLQAVALTALAESKGSSGDNDGARAGLEEAGAILDRALQIGRSDPELLESACERYREQMRVERRRNGPLPPLLDGVRARCGEARAADPERVRGWVMEAAALDIWAETLLYQGKDPTETTAREIELAEHALGLDARNLTALSARGGAWETRAEWQSGHGADPLPAYQHALENFDRINTIDRTDRNGASGQGRIHGRLALLDVAAGRDPGANLDKAVANFRQVIEFRPKDFAAWGNLGTMEFLRAQSDWYHGGDPTAGMQASLRDSAQALAINPRSPDETLNSGVAHRVLAELDVARDADPEPHLAEAERFLRHALELFPDMPQAYRELAVMEETRAEYALDGGHDPRKAIARGLQAVDQAIAADHDYLDAWNDRARLELLTARAALRDHRSAEEALAGAERALDRVQALDGKNVPLWTSRAWLHRWRAAARPDRLEAEVTAGLEAVRRALAVDAGNADAHDAAAALHRAAGHTAEAAAEQARAVELNRWLKAR